MEYSDHKSTTSTSPPAPCRSVAAPPEVCQVQHTQGPHAAHTPRTRSGEELDELVCSKAHTMILEHFLDLNTSDDGIATMLALWQPQTRGVSTH